MRNWEEKFRRRNFCPDVTSAIIQTQIFLVLCIYKYPVGLGTCIHTVIYDTDIL